MLSSCPASVRRIVLVSSAVTINPTFPSGNGIYTDTPSATETTSCNPLFSPCHAVEVAAEAAVERLNARGNGEVSLTTLCVTTMVGGPLLETLTGDCDLTDGIVDPRHDEDHGLSLSPITPPVSPPSPSPHFYQSFDYQGDPATSLPLALVLGIDWVSEPGCIVDVRDVSKAAIMSACAWSSPLSQGRYIVSAPHDECWTRRIVTSMLFHHDGIERWMVPEGRCKDGEGDTNRIGTCKYVCDRVQRHLRLSLMPGPGVWVSAVRAFASLSPPHLPP